MLTLIPDYAAVDETTRRFDEVRSVSPPSAVDAASVFEAYEESAFSMIDRRGEVMDRVPDDLLARHDSELDTLICRHIGLGALGLVNVADADIDGTCRFGNLRFAAASAEIALPSCTGAAPTSMQNCP